jgi:tripartite-type tricarboxylate transporter receptor subunit TctC
MNHRAIAFAVWSALLICAADAQERADSFPSRSIKIVVPFPAGGPSDVLARMIGQKMSEDWGQPVVIENRSAPTPSSAPSRSRRRRLMATPC